MARADVQTTGGERSEADGGTVTPAEALETGSRRETATEDESGLGAWFGPVRSVARREYRLAIRRRWALGMTVLFGVFAVGIVLFGGSSVGPTRYGALLATLVELGVYVVPLVALVAGYDTVVGAAARGSLDMLFALPVSRPQLLVGKYLGRLAVLGGAIAVGLGAGGVLAVQSVGLAGAGSYATVLLAAVLTGAAFLSVSVLVSTLASKPTHALGGVLVAWLWFVLLHDLAAIGLVAAVELPEALLAATVLANPADVFRLFVLSGLETAPGGFAAVLAEMPLSAPVLLAALVAWIVVPLAVAALRIRHRQV